MGVRGGLMACVLLLSGGAMAAAQNRIVAFGDSTTATRGKLVIYAQILQKELPDQGVPVEVINAGIGGNTTRAAKQRFKKDVLDQNPALVIIQFGINDSAVDVGKTPPATEPRVPMAEYRQNLEYFVDTLRAANVRPLLMTPNPMRWTPRLKEMYGKPPYKADDPDGFNVLLKDYADVVRQVAKEKQVELVDVYAQYQAFNAMEGQTMDSLLLDGMHPNEKGHRMTADLLLAAIPALLKK